MPYAVAEGIVGCLSESEFHEAVRRRLSDDSFASGAAVSVATRIERDGQRLRATIVLQDVGASAPVEAVQEIFAARDECAPLSAAAALAVSLTIERSRAHARVEPPPSPPEPPREVQRAAASRPPRPPSPRRAPAPTAAAEDRQSRELRTHALLTGGYGILPDASIGAASGASLKLERWSAQLEAGAWLPTTVESGTGDGGARAWLIALSAAGCLHAGRSFVCGVGTLGELRASGTGRLLSRSSGSTYLALGARVGTELPLAGPFSLLVHVGALAPLLRPSLRIGNELLWRAPVVGGELGIGIRMSIL